MLTGTNLQQANSYNIRIVLETVRLHGPLSRIEISRRTRLTAQTVTNITKKLLAVGLIVEAERLQEGRGAPSILLRLNPDAAFSVGLDFDKDHLTGVLVDLSGRIRQRENLDLDFPSPEEALSLMTRTVNRLIERENVDRSAVWGVGVGLPGPLIISEGSVVTNVANPKFLPGWNHVPVVEILGRRLDLPVHLENNASAAAIGEKWYGEGRHSRTFFYLFFGAGLGGGLILNGEPYSGFSGNAGEIGYFPSPRLAQTTTNGDPIHSGIHFNLPRLMERTPRPHPARSAHAFRAKGAPHDALGGGSDRRARPAGSGCGVSDRPGSDLFRRPNPGAHHPAHSRAACEAAAGVQNPRQDHHAQAAQGRIGP
jgi:hypothetical protein